MLLTGLTFFILSFITYTLVSLFGQLTGGSDGTFWEDILEVFKPIPLVILLVSNLFFAAALSIGFKLSPYAPSMAIAVGVIASFVYASLFLGGTVTLFRIVGVVLVLAGIYLLR